MSMTLSAFPLSFISGTLTTLSPCVLPLLPMIIGSAASEHRYGVVALASGLVLSFSVIGVTVASIGLTLDFDPSIIRYISASFLIVFGLLLLSQYLQDKLSALLSPVGSATQTKLAHLQLSGLAGQFLIGLSLGAVWSPCVGPTLGTAIGLASQGENLFQVSLVMALFGLGAITPMMIIGLLTRQQFTANKERLLTFAYWSKRIMGVAMLLIATLVLTGWDKQVEAYALEHLPESVIEWSVKY